MLLPQSFHTFRATMTYELQGREILATLVASQQSTILTQNSHSNLIIWGTCLLIVFGTGFGTRFWNRWHKSKLSEEERNPAYMYSWY